MKNCYIYYQCKQAESEVCRESCWKYIQLNIQYAAAGIPPAYTGEIKLVVDEGKRDLDAFIFLRDYMINAYKNIKTERKGLFLWSERKGNGKTSWAIKILKEYFRQLHRTVETFEGPKGLFINVPILFDDLRAGIDDPAPKIKRLEKLIETVDILILDDIGTEAPTKWVKEKLYIFITKRELAGLPTIYTSNHDLKTLESEELLGERIVDRIYKQAGDNIIQLHGGSKRRRP